VIFSSLRTTVQCSSIVFGNAEFAGVDNAGVDLSVTAG